MLDRFVDHNHVAHFSVDVGALHDQAVRLLQDRRHRRPVAIRVQVDLLDVVVGRDLERAEVLVNQVGLDLGGHRLLGHGVLRR